MFPLTQIVVRSQRTYHCVPRIDFVPVSGHYTLSILTVDLFKHGSTFVGGTPTPLPASQCISLSADVAWSFFPPLLFHKLNYLQKCCSPDE